MATERDELPSQRPGIIQLAVVLLRIGAVSFGGLGSTLSVLQRELVDRRHWLKESDFRDALAFTKPLPGSTVVQVVSFLGWRMRRVPGALLATASFLLPSFLVMSAAAVGTALLPDVAWVRGAMHGVQIGVVGLLASALWRLALGLGRGRASRLVLLASFGLGLAIPAAFVVLGAGVVGLIVAPPREAPGA